jgi:hypothetical protein
MANDHRKRPQGLTPRATGSPGGKPRQRGPARKRVGLPRAVSGSEGQPLRLGGVAVPCYVLDDGRRVLVTAGTVPQPATPTVPAGGGEGGGLARLVAAGALTPFLPADLTEKLNRPIRFLDPRGAVTDGSEAAVLAELCAAVLTARKGGRLGPSQAPVVAWCEALGRGLSRVGVLALVDEAAGYQDTRQRDALARALEDHVTNELRQWVGSFPPDFYGELCRLRGLPDDGAVPHPLGVAGLIDDLVSQRLAPGVREALGAGNPAYGGPRWPPRYNRWLTAVGGPPEFGRHLESVITLMKASDTWEQFLERLDRALPQRTDVPPPA